LISQHHFSHSCTTLCLTAKTGFKTFKQTRNGTLIIDQRKLTKYCSDYKHRLCVYAWLSQTGNPNLLSSDNTRQLFNSVRADKMSEIMQYENEPPRGGTEPQSVITTTGGAELQASRTLINTYVTNFLSARTNSASTARSSVKSSGEENTGAKEMEQPSSSGEGNERQLRSTDTAAKEMEHTSSTGEGKERQLRSADTAANSASTARSSVKSSGEENTGDKEMEQTSSSDEGKERQLRSTDTAAKEMEHTSSSGEGKERQLRSASTTANWLRSSVKDNKGNKKRKLSQQLQKSTKKKTRPANRGIALNQSPKTPAKTGKNKIKQKSKFKTVRAKTPAKRRSTHTNPKAAKKKKKSGDGESADDGESENDFEEDDHEEEDNGVCSGMRVCVRVWVGVGGLGWCCWGGGLCGTGGRGRGGMKGGGMSWARVCRNMSGGCDPFLPHLPPFYNRV
jgi:hypothetical protein